MTSNLKLDYAVLSDYLRNNLSTRQICRKYSELADKTGFKSHEIIKRYNLETKHKGFLFLLSRTEARPLVEQIMKTKDPTAILTDGLNPKWLEKYRGATILSDSEDCAYNCLDGELRNTIMRFFRERKKTVGVCQYTGCKNTDLDCAHRHNKTRKSIFVRAAKKYKSALNGQYKFPVYDIMKEFLTLHKKGIIYFLCKEHHRQYDNSDKPSEFLNKIRD